MQMQTYLQENNTLVIPDAAVTMTASTAVTSTYIKAVGCDVIECVLFLTVSAVGATSVGLIEILAASDSSGTGATAVTFKDIYKTIGATTIKLGTGLPVKIEQMSGTVPTALASYSTLAADGDKQQLFVIPIRTRHLPEGLTWVAVRFTAGSATARSGHVSFVRRYNNYGVVVSQTSIFA